MADLERPGLARLPALDAHMSPLVKSAKQSAVGQNIKTELAAGRPRKQAIAIALSTQRQAQKKAGSKKR